MHDLIDDGSYTVQPNDSLSKIAEGFHTTSYSEILESNLDREQLDGRTLAKGGLIHPGWRLIIPEPPKASDRSA